MRRPVWITTTVFVFGTLALGWLDLSGMLRTARGRSYTYERDDYPRVWPIAPLRPVLMTRESTVHYRFDSTVGSLEWDTLLPSGGVVVHLGPKGRPFTISLFHQLRCLQIINDGLAVTYRAGLARTNSTPSEFDTTTRNKMETHCMNYLRQMILCRANARLEPMKARYGATKTVWEATHVCHDWSAVYGAAEENYGDYLRRGGREFWTE